MTAACHSLPETEMAQSGRLTPGHGVAEREWVGVLLPGDARVVTWLAALSAAGIGYEVVVAGDWVILVVEEGVVGAVLEEIGTYELANKNWPPADVRPEEGVSDTNLLAAIIVVCLTSLAYLKTGAAGSEFFVGERGVLDSVAVSAGEIWRLVTSLGLHVDPMHLFANGVCLLVFGAVAGARLGFGTAWVSILMGGASGNLLSVLLARHDFRAVGASTAVFAALGLLVSARFISLCRQGGHCTRSFFERRWLPILAGMALLAMLGSSPGAHLEGHLYGLLAGLVVGAASYPVKRFRSFNLLQQFLFAAFLAVNVFAWTRV